MSESTTESIDEPQCRNPVDIINNIIAVTEKYSVYNGMFKEQIDSLRSTTMCLAPELPRIPYIARIVVIVHNHFSNSQNAEFMKELGDVIEGKN